MSGAAAPRASPSSGADAMDTARPPSPLRAEPSLQVLLAQSGNWQCWVRLSPFGQLRVLLSANPGLWFTTPAGDQRWRTLVKHQKAFERVRCQAVDARPKVRTSTSSTAAASAAASASPKDTQLEQCSLSYEECCALLSLEWETLPQSLTRIHAGGDASAADTSATGSRLTPRLRAVCQALDLDGDGRVSLLEYLFVVMELPVYALLHGSPEVKDTNLPSWSDAALQQLDDLLELAGILPSIQDQERKVAETSKKIQCSLLFPTSDDPSFIKWKPLLETFDTSEKRVSFVSSSGAAASASSSSNEERGMIASVRVDSKERVIVEPPATSASSSSSSMHYATRSSGSSFMSRINCPDPDARLEGCIVKSIMHHRQSNDAAEADSYFSGPSRFKELSLRDDMMHDGPVKPSLREEVYDAVPTFDMAALEALGPSILSGLAVELNLLRPRLQMANTHMPAILDLPLEFRFYNTAAADAPQACPARRLAIDTSFTYSQAEMYCAKHHTDEWASASDGFEFGVVLPGVGQTLVRHIEKKAPHTFFYEVVTALQQCAATTHFGAGSKLEVIQAPFIIRVVPRPQVQLVTQQVLCRRSINSIELQLAARGSETAPSLKLDLRTITGSHIVMPLIMPAAPQLRPQSAGKKSVQRLGGSAASNAEVSSVQASSRFLSVSSNTPSRSRSLDYQVHVPGSALPTEGKFTIEVQPTAVEQADVTIAEQCPLFGSFAVTITDERTRQHIQPKEPLLIELGMDVDERQVLSWERKKLELWHLDEVKGMWMPNEVFAEWFIPKDDAKAAAARSRASTHSSSSTSAQRQPECSRRIRVRVQLPHLTVFTLRLASAVITFDGDRINEMFNVQCYNQKGTVARGPPHAPKPYALPHLFTKTALQVGSQADFDAKYGSWYVAFHGSSRKVFDSIIAEGLLVRNQKKHVPATNFSSNKPMMFNPAAHPNPFKGSWTEALFVSCSYMYALFYSRTTKVEHWSNGKDGGDGSTWVTEMRDGKVLLQVFQLRVDPSKIETHPETISGSEERHVPRPGGAGIMYNPALDTPEQRIHSCYSNAELEWRIPAEDAEGAAKVYGAIWREVTPEQYNQLKERFGSPCAAKPARVAAADAAAAAAPPVKANPAFPFFARLFAAK